MGLKFRTVRNPCCSTCRGIKTRRYQLKIACGWLRRDWLRRFQRFTRFARTTSLEAANTEKRDKSVCKCSVPVAVPPRGQSAPVRVALEDAAAPNPEEEGVLTAALSSYEPGNVAGTPTLPSTDRELSSFVSLAKCCGRPEAHGLTLAQAAALISAPNRRSEADLCSVFSRTAWNFRRGSRYVQGTR